MILNTAIGFSNVNTVRSAKGFIVNPFMQCIKHNYLAITIRDNIRLRLTGNKEVFVEYSYDLSSWVRLRRNVTLILTRGVKCYLRGINPTGFGDNAATYTRLSITSGSCYIEGDLKSLIDYRGNAVLTPYCFYGFFKDCSNLFLKNLVLDAEYLPDYAYSHLFAGSSVIFDTDVVRFGFVGDYALESVFENCNKNLYQLPGIVANEVGMYTFKRSYYGCTRQTSITIDYGGDITEGLLYETCNGCTAMTSFSGILKNAPKRYSFYGTFGGCTSLTSPPIDNIGEFDTDAEYCCYRMYIYCTSMIKSAVIESMNTAESCFEGMYANCSLMSVTQDSLPAGYVAKCAYRFMYQNAGIENSPKVMATSCDMNACPSMFEGCAKIEKAEVKITTTDNNWAERMFNGCSMLKVLKVNFEEWLPNMDQYAYWWLGGVSESGVIFCPYMLEERRGNGYIPDDWEIVRI